MIRSAAALVMLAILPGSALAQEPQTHTVAEGETLWGIAARYLGDAYQWPRIHDANRDRVADPNRITPGLELAIPGDQAQVTDVQVVTEPMAAGEPAPSEVQVPAAGISVPTTRAQQGTPPPTVFRRELASTISSSEETRELLDVSPEEFYRAPWLIPVRSVPTRSGEVLGLSGGENVRAERGSARPNDRVDVAVGGAAPAVGSRLQVFRVVREIPDVGRVVEPSGVLVVESVTSAGVVAWVDMQFARLLTGDLVRPLPQYTPRPASALQAVTGGAEATLLGFAVEHELQSLGDHAFLDAGGDQGVRIGDEYASLWPGEAPGGSVEGRAKVVAVLPGVSTVRIIDLRNPVFVTGARLTQSRRAP